MEICAYPRESSHQQAACQAHALGAALDSHNLKGPEDIHVCRQMSAFRLLITHGCHNDMCRLVSSGPCSLNIVGEAPAHLKGPCGHGNAPVVVEPTEIESLAGLIRLQCWTQARCSPGAAAILASWFIAPPPLHALPPGMSHIALRSQAATCAEHGHSIFMLSF